MSSLVVLVPDTLSPSLPEYSRVDSFTGKKSLSNRSIVCHCHNMEVLLRSAQWLALGAVTLLASNIIRQLLPRNKSKPPTVFHWFPFIGNAIDYGMSPYDFFAKNREKVSHSCINIISRIR